MEGTKLDAKIPWLYTTTKANAIIEMDRLLFFHEKTSSSSVELPGVC
jgi:hypothetical protein